MNNITNSSILQDSSALSSTNQAFSASELFESLSTWQKCYDAITHNNLTDPIKDFSFNRQATLLYDFLHFLKEGRPLLEKTLGTDWLNVPCFRWGIQYPEKDRTTGTPTGRMIKKPLNPATHTAEGWGEGRSMSALETIKGLLTADNYQAWYGKKNATYFIAAFPTNFLVVDVDFHDGEKYDPRQEFIDWLEANHVPCLLESTKKGLHAYFANNGAYKQWTSGSCQIALKNGELLPIEILACSWDEEAQKYNNSRSCFLGCERVENYSTPENCRLLNFEEGQDVDFKLPTALHITAKTEKGNKKSSYKTQGRNEKQIRAAKLANKTGFFTDEKFSRGRHHRIFDLVCLYQLLYPEWSEAQLTEAILEWNRDRHNPSYSDEEAARNAHTAYEKVYLENGLKDLDDWLSKTCKVPLDGVSYALDQLGLSLSYSEMNQTISIDGSDKDDLDSLTTSVHNVLRSHLSSAVIADNLIEIGKRNSAHPVLSYLQTLPASDDDSELQKLYKLLKIEDKWLEKVCLLKWLKQAVCALHNGKEGYFPLEYVLVLQGKQGAGKSSLFAHLAINPKYFTPGHLLNPDRDDSKRTATSTWITELGELDSTTTRADVGALKSFISLPSDTYRIPYDRFSKSYPRRTVFCGTVNPQEFLRDETGNRRFLPIALPDGYRLPFAELEAIDTASLWAYIYTQVEREHAKGIPYAKIFRLTEEEILALEQAVETHHSLSTTEGAIRDLLYSEIPENLGVDDFTAKTRVNIKTASEIAADLFPGQRISVVQLGKDLKRLGFKVKNHSNKIKYCFWLSQDTADRANNHIKTKYDPSRCKFDEVYKGLEALN